MNDDNELRDIVAKVLDDRDIGDDWDADAILAAIREHHAIVRLDDQNRLLLDGTVHMPNLDAARPTSLAIEIEPGEPIRCSPNYARELAAALLAAADAAEGEQ